MTYLELVNEVLIRLRETSVTATNANAYSILIRTFINEAKRQVEDAWSWDDLFTTKTVTTASGTSEYTVTGSGRRQKDVTVNITTTGQQVRLKLVPPKWIEDQQQLTTTTNAVPGYYAWDGSDGTDSKVELYPTPDGTYTVSFNMYVPQVALSADTDVLTIQSDAVIAGAYARALVERGEDGGLSSSEAYGIYRGILADQIAIDATRNISNDVWEAT